MKKKAISCESCGKSDLTKNDIGACKRLLGRDIKFFYCIDCLAEITGYTKEELLELIKQYKDEGCTLFN